MNLLETMEGQGVEQVIALSEPRCGLRGFIVVDNTSRGPATGGIRLFPYREEEEALRDGFRLSRAMTLKAAAADLPVGGGKIVLMDHADLDRDEALRATGRAIACLKGRFLAGRDVGLRVADGAIVSEQTEFMVDESDEGVGDLNYATAVGVESGARAALAFGTGRADWQGATVAIQGAGGVGSWLARILHQAGADLLVNDPNEAALEALRDHVTFQAVGVDAILELPVDLFAPCAIGGVLTAESTSRLRASVVAGSANNVLRNPSVGDELFARGIVYAPDFLVNAGALVLGTSLLLTRDRKNISALQAIGERTHNLLERSRDRNVPPERLLLAETEAKLAGGQGWRHWHVPV